MLDCLSNDTLQLINEKLDVASLTELACVSKRFRNVIKEAPPQRPWEQEFLRKAGARRHSIVRSTVKNWKAAVAEEYRKDKRFGVAMGRGGTPGDWGKVADCTEDWRPLLMPKIRMRIMPDDSQQWYIVSHGGKENSGSGAAA